jgi:hypothetical protein
VTKEEKDDVKNKKLGIDDDSMQKDSSSFSITELFANRLEAEDKIVSLYLKLHVDIP